MIIFALIFAVAGRFINLLFRGFGWLIFVVIAMGMIQRLLIATGRRRSSARSRSRHQSSHKTSRRSSKSMFDGDDGEVVDLPSGALRKDQA